MTESNDTSPPRASIPFVTGWPTVSLAATLLESYDMNMCSEPRASLGQALFVPERLSPERVIRAPPTFLRFVAATSETMKRW